MSYEAVQGEIITMSNDIETGVSGVSTEAPGAANKTIEVRWRYPGGISGLMDTTRFDEWGGLGEQISPYINQYETNQIDKQTFINNVNTIIYNRVSQLLQPGYENPSWNEWSAPFNSCISIIF